MALAQIYEEAKRISKFLGDQHRWLQWSVADARSAFERRKRGDLDLFSAFQQGFVAKASRYIVFKRLAKIIQDKFTDRLADEYYDTPYDAMLAVIDFNNNSATTHADVMAVLEELIRPERTVNF